MSLFAYPALAKETSDIADAEPVYIEDDYAVSSDVNIVMPVEPEAAPEAPVEKQVEKNENDTESADEADAYHISNDTDDRMSVLLAAQSDYEAREYKTQIITSADDSAFDCELGNDYIISLKVPAGAFDNDTLFFAGIMCWSDLTDAQISALATEGMTPETDPVLFDIGFYDAEIGEVEPSVPIYMTISANNIVNEGDNLTMDVYHLSETEDDVTAEIVASTNAEKVTATITGDVEDAGTVSIEDGAAVATIEAGSFSIYAVKFTVDFYLGEHSFHLEGEGSILLSELLAALNADVSAADIVSMEWDAPEGLLEFEQIAGDWRITSLAPFTEWYKLKLTAADGTVYTIDVTDAAKYLTFSSPSSFSISVSSKGWDGTMQYSTNASAWTTWDGSSITSVASGGTYYLYFRGTGNTKIGGSRSSYKWTITGSNVSCNGDIRMLLNYSNVNGVTPAIYTYGFMFYQCTALVKTPELPATTLASGCYSYMFSGCTGLTTAPALPATTLASDCYGSMFQNCTSLTTAPELPATTLAYQCYYSMFRGCTGLTTAPSNLPATTLADYCYYYMFYGCTSLTTAPNLPATTVAQYCYAYMFQDCTSLTTAPLNLPATTLATHCYYSMFWNCTSLTKAPSLPATTLADGCYYNMFYGCKGLTTAPSNLPATTLVNECYCSMFYNCTSLTTAPSLPATTLADSCCFQMFCGCTSLTTAPSLPATTLAYQCYYSMFRGCKGLTTAPELPATTLANYCYRQMFSGCTSLTTAPSLPATTLADSCYFQMFSGCKGLTTAPELPATILASGCYGNMFENCTNLTTAPDLPATTLAASCYQSMFSGCTGLTTAPELPVTTLASGCYNYMFSGCTGLTTAPELPATTLAARCYNYMFSGCKGLTTPPDLPVTTLADYCYYYMFYGCTGIKLSETQTGNYQLPYRVPTEGTGTTATNALYNMFVGTGGTFTGTPEINTTYYLYQEPSIYAIFDGMNNGTLIFFLSNDTPTSYTYEGTTYIGTVYSGVETQTYGEPSWYSNNDLITTVIFADTIQPETTYSWFDGCINLSTITGISNLDTGNVTSMYRMFYGCSGLTSLDISGFDTSNVTDMRQMFTSCAGLTSLTVPANFVKGSAIAAGDTSYYPVRPSQLNVAVQNGVQSPVVSGTNDLKDVTVETTYIKVVTITFYNGSTTNTQDISGPTNLTAANTLFTAPSGYTFYGWATSSSTSTRTYTNQQSVSFTSDTSLYAIWSRTISFYSGKGRSATTNVQQYYYNGVMHNIDAPSSATTPVENCGWTLDGWATETAVNASIIAEPSGSFIPTTTTYYARWSRTITLNYDSNGGSGETAPSTGTQYFNSFSQNAVSTVEIELKASSFTSPERASFCGWGVFNTATSGYGVGDIYPVSNLQYNSNYLSRTVYAIWTQVMSLYDSTNTTLVIFRGDPTTPDTTVSYTYDGDGVTYSGTLYKTNLETWSSYNTPWYSNRASITKVIIADITVPIDTYSWFYDESNLTDIIGIENLDTSNVTRMSSMFSGCSSLTSLDVSGFDTSNVTTMYHMFARCSSLTSLDVTGFDTRNVTDMGYMFNDCSGLTSLDVSGFDTSNVVSLGGMFQGCSNLTFLDVSGFNTSNVTSMYGVFERCTSLADVAVSDWDTSKVTTFLRMFSACDTMTTLDLSSWNTSNATILNGMFSGCDNLTTINLAGWNTSKVTEMQDMFYGSDAISSLTLPGYFFSGSAVTEDYNIPRWPTQLNSAIQNGVERAIVTGDNDFKSITVETEYVIGECACGIFDSNKGTLILFFGRYSQTPDTYEYNGVVYSAGAKFRGFEKYDTGYSSAWSSYRTSISTVIIAEPIALEKSTDNWFSGCSNLTAVIGLANLDTSTVVSMENMFKNCSSLTSLNVSGVETGSVTNMYGMFSGCSGLTSLDLSGWDTDNVANMRYMFYNCSGLTSLDVSGFDTGNVTAMDAMFSNCSGLTSLNVNGFDTGNVTNMYSMFNNCSGLTSLNISGFDTSNVTNMSNMFYGCSGLTSLTVPANFVPNIMTSNFPTRPSRLAVAIQNGNRSPVVSGANDLRDVKVQTTYTSDFIVIYNMNGGTIENESSYTSHPYGSTLTLPTPERVGYAFGGWYDNADLTGTAVTSIGATVTGDKEYWAKWSVIFSVTVPTNITITMDSDGTVTTPSDVKIINNSYAPVEVTAVNIIGQNGWSAAAPSADFSATPINTKQFKLTLNGDTVPAGNTSALTLGSGWTYIPANGDGKTEAQHALPLIIDADIVRQSEETNAAIANIVFTVNLKAA